MIDSWQVAGWIVTIAICFMLFPRVIKGIVALVILHALLVNPKRYEYIEKLAQEVDENGNKKYSNYALTEKNINKARMMAEQFLNWKNW